MEQVGVVLGGESSIVAAGINASVTTYQLCSWTRMQLQLLLFVLLIIFFNNWSHLNFLPAVVWTNTQLTQIHLHQPQVKFRIPCCCSITFLTFLCKKVFFKKRKNNFWKISSSNQIREDWRLEEPKKIRINKYL